MTSSIEYFYNDALRWGFGFSNPNKAAVLFTSLLPLLFLLWDLAWSLNRHGWLRVIFIITSGLLVLGDGFCLFKTYSRGGVVAAGVAVIYFFLRRWKLTARKEWRRPAFVPEAGFTCLLIGLLIALFFGVGLGDRSAEPLIAGDASVAHRLTLWRSALQMAVDNPSGFGAGNSGAAYMQWYQPLDATSAYRTLVSSYLTFLVEQGWIWFSLVLTGLALFWFWAKPGTHGSPGLVVARGLRASILAFLVAGVFSTVMEEPVLWIMPVLCISILVVWSLFRHVRLNQWAVVRALVLTFIALSGLYIGGVAAGCHDPLSREFTSEAGRRTVSQLALANSSDRQKTWVIVPDVDVLGPCYGKLLRQLVIQTGITLEIKTPANLRDHAERLLVTGNGVNRSVISFTTTTVLLTPAPIPASAAQAWLTSSPNLVLLVPSIDPDRRSSFWRRCVPEPIPPHLTVTKLNGVGVRVDWDWNQVIALIDKSS